MTSVPTSVTENTNVITGSGDHLEVLIQKYSSANNDLFFLCFSSCSINDDFISVHDFQFRAIF